MYMVDSMIDLGLKEGQKFPTGTHRAVARALVIGNPRVTNRDQMQEIVGKVLLVPEDRIADVTFKEMKADFGLPEHLF